MSTLKLLGDSSGYVQLVANTAAQNNTLTLPNVNDTLANITSPTFLSNIALAGTGTAPSIGLFTPSANTLAFATNTTQVLTINSTGNVGIGSSTPQQTLDVQGNVNVLNTVIMGSSFLRNVMINGAMGVAQRGTSFSLASAGGTGYTLDRMYYYNGVGATITISQISSIGLTGFNNAIRVQRNSGVTNTGAMITGQIIESVNCLPLAGNAVTISFWARAGTNYSATSNALTVRFTYGTGTDQGLAAYAAGTWTGQTTLQVNVTLTTAWQRFVYQTNAPSTATEIAVDFYATVTGTAGTNDYYDVTGFQVEPGPVATPFERKLYNQVLADCQRYYFQIGGVSAQPLYTGQASSATQAYIPMVFPVTLRTAPSGSNFSVSANSDWYMVNASVGSALTWTGSSITNADAQTALLVITVASGLVAGNASFAQAANTSARIKFSAEL
jgi:hypothetical protein